MKNLALYFVLVLATLFSACDGGSSDTSSGGTTGMDAGTDGSTEASNATFTVSGVVSGLAGMGLTLQNGTENVAVSANGVFTFMTPVASGATYAVTVSTQPSMPAQQCTVTNGSGTATANVTNVTVACTTSQFTIGGNVIGLAGTGLVLKDNNGDNLTVAASGAFTFATPVASGSAFSVTVTTQPTGPAQTCTVVGGTGTVGSANVTDVMVNCGGAFVVGGQITGLAGANVVLQNNGGDNLTVTANGTFAFASPVGSGSMYAVTVLTQPSNPTQTCTVSMGTGTVSSANITSVMVACTTNTYTVGGTVSGLTGTGLVLQDSGGDNLAVSASGAFTFATPLVSGAPYAVTVLTQPTGPTQTCTLSTGTDTGTVTNANVTTVAIVCSVNSYTVGGTLTGLAMSDSLVLENNGGDSLVVSANGAFTFATPVASGAGYNVTVLTQPGAPAQSCVVSGGMGNVVAGIVTSVTVNCTTNTYAVGGTISGLAGTLVLRDNGGDNLTLTANGMFAFATPLTSGSTYAVTVLTQPGTPAQTCVVTNGSGPITNAPITTVAVLCTTNKYTVGGTISGLATNESVVLQDNGADNLTVSANGTFTFATSIASGQAFAVTVLTNPASPFPQTCVATAGTSSGTIGAAIVTTVAITCTTNTYTIGGTVTGLAGTGLVLQDNGGDNLTVSTNGTFTFGMRVSSGGAYAVTLLANPTTPWQTCVITSPSGTVTNTAITNVVVTCTTNKYTVGGTITGLASGDSLVIQDNGTSNLTVSASGAFTFGTSLASGSAYAVTILTQSGLTAQTCAVSGGMGVVAGLGVTSVAINCMTNNYTIGGTVSGLVGAGLVLRNNGGDDRPITADGSFSFATPIASDATYNVTILSQPTSPSQTCTLTNFMGTVAAAPVTNVGVTCTTNNYSIGVTVSGLASGESVVLQDNGADNLTVNANGGFTFATPIPSGTSYTVTTLTNPATPYAQTCAVTVGTGMVTNAPVTNVIVTCTGNPFTIGGTASGLTGSAVLVTNGNTVTVSTNGAFTFPTSLASGTVYAVTVQSAPSGETCTITNGNGTITNAPITNVLLSCSVPAILAHNITDGTNAYMSQNGAGTLYKVNPSSGAATLLASGVPSGGFTLAVNGAGTLFAGTQGASPSVIYTVNTTTGVFTTFATLPAGAGDWICGMWFDPAGNLYFNIATSTSVYKVTPAGVVSTFITSADGHLTGNSTQGTTDSAGNHYIATRAANEIFKYNSGGTWVSTLSASCAPWGIAAPTNGTLLYTCDSAIVYQLNLSTLANTTFVTLAGTTLAYMSLDPAGNIYVGQWSHNGAYKLSPTGTTLWSTLIGSSASTAF